MSVLDKRLLGPINKEMGGDPEGGSGGGGSGVTITNNVSGYLLRATGDANKIAGVPQLQWDSARTALSASADMYISGSNNYLYLHGTNASGQTVRFQVQISGSMFKVTQDNPEGSI
jgi:hypothetical protein